MSQNQPNQNPSSDRDARGRFAKGNSGGPGNPNGRQVARLRMVMLDCLTDEDFRTVTRTLVDLAKEGNIQALRLLFSYVLGKPTQAMNPEPIDFQAWLPDKQPAPPETNPNPQPHTEKAQPQAQRQPESERSIQLMTDALDLLDRQDRLREQRQTRKRRKAQKKAKGPKSPPSPIGNSEVCNPSEIRICPEIFPASGGEKVQ